LILLLNPSTHPLVCLARKSFAISSIQFSHVFKNVSKQCTVLSFTRFIQCFSANFARLFVIGFSKSSVSALHNSEATFNWGAEGKRRSHRSFSSSVLFASGLRNAHIAPCRCVYSSSESSCFNRRNSCLRNVSNPLRYNFATWKRSITILTCLPNISFAA